jgi:GNAT superfamily N-acetyltransferase
MSATLRPIRPDEHRLCERILRALPEWFGIEESLVQYVRDTATMPTFIAEHDSEPAGFITLRCNTDHAAEIHCMAVAPQMHRKGVGRRMVRFAEDHLRSEGVSYLQVKTVGPSRPCEFYSQTRLFYEAAGFAPLEEFPTLWPGNPCLLLVKKIA